jgi:hypothetical protein
MRVELYLYVAGVTVSQNVAIKLLMSSGKCETGVTYMYATAGCSRLNTLDYVDCGGCLLDASCAANQSWVLAPRVHPSPSGGQHHVAEMRTNMTTESGSRSCERSPRRRALQAQRSEMDDGRAWSCYILHGAMAVSTDT